MDCSSTSTAPITTFADGEEVRIRRIGVRGRDAHRLRDHGLHKGCEVCVRARADTCVLDLDTCAFSVQPEIAAQILASPVSDLRRLPDLAPGQCGTIRRYDTDAPPRRLLEMGLVPGTTVQFVRRAPPGDPFYLKSRGQALAIRTHHARLIYVHAA
ncbi:Fe2+ transport system protein FeoA [Salinibacter ruber]|uniref:Fe2+ transport system protein FeoA n=1 Tax=Salinibacter ruber TaxID=146919 RepID=A0AAW5PBN8_9BACT|nr:Fe2+ transport system protein FeoA [Salinibacter ruber]MCS4159365.1 Fe2+ transport system protein FeoA [Salinibacter ruber]MCS4223831.1 Fe2+ transport system protein FeoA [Salinibacter ruber]